MIQNTTTTMNDTYYQDEVYLYIYWYTQPKNKETKNNKIKKILDKKLGTFPKSYEDFSSLETKIREVLNTDYNLILTFTYKNKIMAYNNNIDGNLFNTFVNTTIFPEIERMNRHLN